MASLVSGERQRELRRAVDIARSAVRLVDIGALTMHLLGQGLTLSAADVLDLQDLGPGRMSPDYVPPLLARFAQLYIDPAKVTTILDPFGNAGLLAAWIAECFPAVRVDVATPRRDIGELTVTLGKSNLRVIPSDLKDATSALAARYDAIVTVPQIHLPPLQADLIHDGRAVTVRDEATLVMLATLASRLSDHGYILAVVSPRFAFETKPRAVRTNLQALGLSLSALLQFPRETFAGTSISFELALLSRRKVDTLYVAELPSNLDDLPAFVARLKERKQGPTASQGRLVSPSGYRGLAALEARERYDKLAKGKGYAAIPFTVAVPSVRSPSTAAGEAEPFEEEPTAVYLPQMAKTNAQVRQADLPPRLKSYLQLTTNPDVVLPEYLAQWLNTPLGHAFRESVMSGATIPRISAAAAEHAKLYLPGLKDQQHALEVLREIHRLQSDLRALEERLREQPTKAASVLTAVRTLNREEGFADWVETLPFPLAAILRTYHAVDSTPKDKYERLLHFFEAFTALIAAIHVSAARNSASAWSDAKNALRKTFADQHLSLRRASFGTWKTIAEYLGGQARALLSAKEDGPGTAMMRYVSGSREPIDFLASAEVVSLFQRVNTFRNRWTGHGGAVTPAEAEERHSLLAKDLERCRELVGSHFQQYQLLEAAECVVLDGPVFRCRVRRVMGSNPQLEHDHVDLATPATTGRLYFHNPGHSKALELLPFIQVQDAPQPASYFYNRVDGRESQFVSYQFAAQSEISTTNVALLSVLGEFDEDTDLIARP